MKKQLLIIILLSFQIVSAFSQKATVVSPNQKDGWKSSTFRVKHCTII